MPLSMPKPSPLNGYIDDVASFSKRSVARPNGTTCFTPAGRNSTSCTLVPWRQTLLYLKKGCNLGYCHFQTKKVSEIVTVCCVASCWKLTSRQKCVVYAAEVRAPRQRHHLCANEDNSLIDLHHHHSVGDPKCIWRKPINTASIVHFPVRTAPWYLALYLDLSQITITMKCNNSRPIKMTLLNIAYIYVSKYHSALSYIVLEIMHGTDIIHQANVNTSHATV